MTQSFSFAKPADVVRGDDRAPLRFIPEFFRRARDRLRKRQRPPRRRSLLFKVNGGPGAMAKSRIPDFPAKSVPYAKH